MCRSIPSKSRYATTRQARAGAATRLGAMAEAAEASVAAAPQAEPEVVVQKASAPVLTQALTPTRDGERDIHEETHDALEAALPSHISTFHVRMSTFDAHLLQLQEQFDELRALQLRDDP